MADNLGLSFSFRDAGDYVGSPSLSYVPPLGTYIRAVRYNSGGDRRLSVDLFDRNANTWNNIATFSQKRNDWDYNIGDCAIAYGDDGSIMVMTNAGSKKGRNEIEEAWIIIPPHLTGIPASDGKQVVNYVTGVTDQYARDQIAAWRQSIQSAQTKAQGAEDLAKSMVSLVKSEVKKAVDKAIASVSISDQKIKDILWSLLPDRLYVEITNEESALHTWVTSTAQYWGFTKGKDAAYALLKERGMIKE